MKLFNKNFSLFVNILFGGLILLLISLFFYIALKAFQIQETNEQVLSLIREENLQEANDLIETITLTQKNKDYQFVQKFSFFPFVKEKIQLQQELISIKESLEKIQEGELLKVMAQEKENALSLLNDLDSYFLKLEKYDLAWVTEKKHETENWLSFLGKQKEKNYLILFQDPDIPRPAGGFIGAYAYLTFNDGKITLLGDDIFSLEEVFLDKIIPPGPFLNIEDRWFFHDSNWFFDFPLTGQKILSLYSKTGKKPDLDGVIVVNIQTIESVLEATGSLGLINGLYLDNDNFLSFYKTQVQEAAKPAPLRLEKNVLPLFFEKLQEQLAESSLETLAKVLSILKKNLKEKEIQIYLIDDNLQYFFDSYNWTGKVKEGKDDYLGVNISLLKNDFTEDKREKRIELKTEFDINEEIINTLLIDAPDFLPTDRLLENYLKIYLPKGIQIIEAKGGFLKEIKKAKSDDVYEKLDYQKDEDLLLLEQNKILDKKNGIEIYEEGGKTVISSWAQLSSKPFSLVYKLLKNWEQLSDWEIVVQKQSGQKTKFSLGLIMPEQEKIPISLFSFDEFILLDTDLVLDFKFEF